MAHDTARAALIQRGRPVPWRRLRRRRIAAHVAISRGWRRRRAEPATGGRILRRRRAESTAVALGRSVALRLRRRRWRAAKPAVAALGRVRGRRRCAVLLRRAETLLRRAIPRGWRRWRRTESGRRRRRMRRVACADRRRADRAELVGRRRGSSATRTHHCNLLLTGGPTPPSGSIARAVGRGSRGSRVAHRASVGSPAAAPTTTEPGSGCASREGSRKGHGPSPTRRGASHGERPEPLARRKVSRPTRPEASRACEARPTPTSRQRRSRRGRPCSPIRVSPTSLARGAQASFASRTRAALPVSSRK